MPEAKADPEDRKALAEKLIAWASIAYGAGFAVVLLHTARLGVPVLELVKPIYILVGLPLATVLFFWGKIFKWLQSEVADHRAELTLALKQQYITPADDQKVVLEKVILQLSRILPWYFPVSCLRRRFLKILEKSGEKQVGEAQKRFLDRYLRFFQGLWALKRLAELALVIGFAGFLIYLYAWQIYPQLPLAFGGGKPISVRLLVKTPEIPPGVLTLLGTRKMPGEDSATTQPIELLYLASGSYLVRPPGGPVISLEKDVVNGIVYQSNSRR